MIMNQNTLNSPAAGKKSSSVNNNYKSFLTDPVNADSLDFTAAIRQVIRYYPTDIKVANHNDAICFIYSCFAGLDHIEDADFFLAHFDDGDMTFNMDGQVLADNHQSFRNWFAKALTHIPWDYHNILNTTVIGNFQTDWTAEFFIRHVGEWHKISLSNNDTWLGRPL